MRKGKIMREKREAREVKNGVEKEAIESGKEEATVDLMTQEKVLNFDLRYEG